MQETRPLIPRSFRHQLISKSLLVFAAGIGLATAIFLLAIHERPGASYGESFIIFARLQEEVLAKSLLIWGLVFGLTLAGIVALIVLFSHRVVGPLRRLGGSLRLMAAGDFNQAATLRESDAIQPLAREIDALGGRYREMMREVRGQVRELEGQAERVEAARNAAELEAVMADVGRTAREIERTLGCVRL